MIVNNARTVSEALHNGLHALRVQGIKQESRVGDVIVLPQPMMTVYHNPLNRVLFSPMRDANPFFHVMETLWMLAGRNDLPWLAQFNSNIVNYSDDGGKTQPGAYGLRWRNWFGYDQLKLIIAELKNNPQTRRCVLAMWDGGQAIEVEDNGATSAGDLTAAINGSADVPCNTHAYFDTIDGKLNMTVCCRSNDIIWGAYGANAVHFSFLLEYVSAMTGLPMGVYRQFSNNFHLYTNIVPEASLMPMARDAEASDRYFVVDKREVPWGAGTGTASNRAIAELRRIPLVTLESPISFDEDLKFFMEDGGGNYGNCFFSGVAQPMFNAYMAFKVKDYEDAIHMAEQVTAEDWRIACVEWLKRRQIKANVNQQRFTEVVEEPPHEAA